jgi:hypothetical protein
MFLLVKRSGEKMKTKTRYSVPIFAILPVLGSMTLLPACFSSGGKTPPPPGGDASKGSTDKYFQGFSGEKVKSSTTLNGTWKLSKIKCGGVDEYSDVVETEVAKALISFKDGSGTIKLPGEVLDPTTVKGLEVEFPVTYSITGETTSSVFRIEKSGEPSGERYEGLSGAERRDIVIGFEKYFLPIYSLKVSADKKEFTLTEDIVECKDTSKGILELSFVSTQGQAEDAASKDAADNVALPPPPRADGFVPPPAPPPPRADGFVPPPAPPPPAPGGPDAPPAPKGKVGGTKEAAPAPKGFSLDDVIKKRQEMNVDGDKIDEARKKKEAGIREQDIFNQILQNPELKPAEDKATLDADRIAAANIEEGVKHYRKHLLLVVGADPGVDHAFHKQWISPASLKMREQVQILRDGYLRDRGKELTKEEAVEILVQEFRNKAIKGNKLDDQMMQEGIGKLRKTGGLEELEKKHEERIKEDARQIRERKERLKAEQEAREQADAL